jgi:hypothetical protein
MTLEEKSIVSIRHELLQSDVCVLRKYINSDVKGHDGAVDYRTRLLKETIGYTCIHFLDFFDSFVFGGFISAHLSGKEWKDIDIFSKNKKLDFMRKLPNFISFALGFLLLWVFTDQTFDYNQ